MSELSEIQRREAMQARLNYLHTLLPEQMQRDQHVNAVAHQHAGRADFSVEACLADMVRQLAKAKAAIQAAYAEHLNTTAHPSMRYVVPGAPDGGRR